VTAVYTGYMQNVCLSLVPNMAYSINEAWFCSSCLKQLFVFNSIDYDDEFHSTITGEDTALVLSRSLSFNLSP